MIGAESVETTLNAHLRRANYVVRYPTSKLIRYAVAVAAVVVVVVVVVVADSVAVVAAAVVVADA